MLLYGCQQGGVTMSDSSYVLHFYQWLYGLPHAAMERLLEQGFAVFFGQTMVLHGANASPHHAPFPPLYRTPHDFLSYNIAYVKLHHPGNQYPLAHLHQLRESVEH
jgi:hypothetical protein